MCSKQPHMFCYESYQSMRSFLCSWSACEQTMLQAIESIKYKHVYCRYINHITVLVLFAIYSYSTCTESCQNQHSLPSSWSAATGYAKDEQNTREHRNTSNTNACTVGCYSCLLYYVYTSKLFIIMLSIVNSQFKLIGLFRTVWFVRLCHLGQ